MSRKRVIQADTDQQIKDFVSTYKYWAILDSNEILFSSEDEKEQFDSALSKSIDIGVKRGKQYLTVRVGSSEHNSRTNDEMIINLQSYYSPEIQNNYPTSESGSPIVLNGFNKPNTNTMTAAEIQTYLNGALERQQKEMEFVNKSTLAGLQAEMKKQQAESEIALLKQMHNQAMNFERQLIERERAELEKEKEELRQKLEEVEEEKRKSKEGLKGFVNTIAGIGKDFADDYIKPKDKKESSLKGKEEETEEVEETKELQFEEETEETNENINEFEEEENEIAPETVLDGIEKMSKEDLQVIAELINEKIQKDKQEEASEEIEETEETKKDNHNEEL